MPPHLDAPGGVKRAVLIEHMIIPPEIAQAVGVVEPAGRRHQVKCLPVWVGRNAVMRARLLPFNQTLQIPKKCIVHVKISFPYFRTASSASMRCTSLPVTASTDAKSSALVTITGVMTGYPAA